MCYLLQILLLYDTMSIEKKGNIPHDCNTEMTCQTSSYSLVINEDDVTFSKFLILELEM